MAAMIDPMIPGMAAVAFAASLPRTRARAFNLFLTHSLTVFGFLEGVEGFPALPLPAKEVTIVEISNPTAVSTAVIVNPCSLKTSLTFSRRLRSSSQSS